MQQIKDKLKKKHKHKHAKETVQAVGAKIGRSKSKRRGDEEKENMQGSLSPSAGRHHTKSRSDSKRNKG